MSISLSFVLPVYNAEASLAREVRHLLDLLAELSVPFELLLIDDGSVDDTLIEARELARHFAQLRVIHRPLRYGHSAAVQWGLREAVAPFVMVHNNRACPITSELRDLWEHRFRGATAPSAVPYRAPHGSWIEDHGLVVESGPLILIHRGHRENVAQLADFVRLPAGSSPRFSRSHIPSPLGAPLRRHRRAAQPASPIESV